VEIYLALMAEVEMVTASPAKLLTAEEFAELPDPEDGSQQELVRGVVITMPQPKPPHGYTCSQVAGHLWQFCQVGQLGFSVTNDTGVITERGPDTVRGPDVAYWSFARQPTVPESYFEVAPDLAVEVLSPSNRRKQVEEKIAEYLKAGTKLVWVLDPMDRTVTVYREPQKGTLLHSGITLDGEEVLPGFQCRVSALFPPEPPESA
jgi:Uma2 family endonuclease